MPIGKRIEGTYGIMAEFNDPQALLDAANATREAGYKDIDAYSPFPIHGLSDAIGFGHTKLSGLVLVMGILGGCGGFFMCWYANVMSYPVNIGGKPLSPWPAWIPITFECTILLAAFGAVFGMLALNGLPMPYHPVFNVKRFENASRDRFFLVIQSRDPKFEADSVYQFMDTLKPREVVDVPW
ncbi:MAG TPA: DUF3341 domain-containing protein [Thermoanaerobaculia bacterium]|jgi:hypothetical protein